MADTDRLDRAHRVVERTGAKLVAIGDGAQLPSIGAGGMFDRLTDIAPSASSRTSTAPRTQPNSARGRTYAPAAPSARWRTTTPAASSTWPTPATRPASRPSSAGPNSPRRHDISEVALISDASNQEIHRLNARAQHHRARARRTRRPRGPTPRRPLRRPPGRPGRDHRPTPPAGRERIENGSRGEVIDITRREALIEFDGTGRGEHSPATTSAAAARLRPPHLPRARRDRHPHARRHRRLADQQGARLRRGIPRPPRHRLVRRPRRPRQRRTRHRPHQTPRQNMRRSRAQTPSLAHPELPDRDYGPGFHRSIAPSRPSRIPGIVRAINRIVQPTSTGANTMSQRLQIVPKN